LGYRLLTVTGKCSDDRVYSSGITIEESYSVSGIVSPDIWSYIVIKFVTDYMDDCQLKTEKLERVNLCFT
jgi:hypothetical protein